MAEQHELLSVALLKADIDTALGIGETLGLEARRVPEQLVVVTIPVHRIEIVPVEVILAAQLDPDASWIHDPRHVHLVHLWLAAVSVRAT